MTLFQPKQVSMQDAIKIASSAGRDAGNRSATRNRRDAWNEDDLSAAQEANRIVMYAFGYAHMLD